MNNNLFVETIKVCDGMFYNLPLHLERMNRTSNNFFATSIPLLDNSLSIPPVYKKGLVKCRLIYSDVLHKVEFSHYQFRKISNISIVEDNEINYEYKALNRERFDRLKTNNTDEILIVKNGYITDTSFSNVVFEKKNGLYIPDTYLLNGTKRRDLLQQGIIREAQITINDLKDYDRMYLINAMIDIEDNISINIKDIFI